ncbi:hypothetical protein L7F22_028471 [Adiantum nelumboides]|nr:hypothetical protein [Adiantum nelumboides]
MEEERAMIREPLKLNIYDLTYINEYMYWVGLGIYHSAIEAYGSEYAYGAHDYPSSGVFEVEPRHCPGFRFRKSLILGTLWMSPEKFRQFVEDITSEYTGDSYNLLLKNCNHFCEDVCMRLVNVHIPGWVNRLARIGSVFSCCIPRSVQDDGIHTLDYDAYKNDKELIPADIGRLASSLAIVPSRRKHLVSIYTLLRDSNIRIFLRDWKLHDVSKNLSIKRLKEH